MYSRWSCLFLTLDMAVSSVLTSEVKTSKTSAISTITEVNTLALSLCGTGYPMDHQGFELTSDYNKNIPPGKNNNVSISLFINRVSAVDENKEEISLDVFLQVYWEDSRIKALEGLQFVELPWDHRHNLWIPDLYIRQLREMRVLSLFQEMTSVRLFMNGTIRVSIGATIIVKCDMDFVLYPLDIQICAVDFSSYKYTAQELSFRWKDDSPVSFPSDFGDGFRLPKYVVSFATDEEERIIFYGEGNHSTARLLIKMSREIRSYLLESYLPSSLFVIISWGSFCVIPEIVPGRMVLLVTTLLSLVTMFDTVRNNSPDALELKSIEVWLISCTLFVFLALMEYFVVLFGIRYDKAWKRRPRKPTLPAPVALPATLLANHSQVRVEPTSSTVSPLPGAANPTPVPSPHGGARVVPTEDDSYKQQLAAQSGGTLQTRDSPTLEASQSTMSESDSGSLARFRTAVERVVLFCGAQRGTLDRFSLCVFPVSFVLFATVYWIIYLNEARKQMSK